jgi:hypothetical protein
VPAPGPPAGEAGVIAGYRAVVDQESVGLPITAFVRITLESHGTDVVERVETEIRQVAEIVEAYLLAGDQDHLLKVTIDSFASYETFVRTRLRTIPGPASIPTTFAFGLTKPTSPLADPVGRSPSRPPRSWSGWEAGPGEGGQCAIGQPPVSLPRNAFGS